LTKTAPDPEFSYPARSGSRRLNTLATGRIDFFYLSSVSEKNSDSVRKEFGLVQFEKYVSVWILQLFTTYV